MGVPVRREGDPVTGQKNDDRVAPVREQDDQDRADRHVDDGVRRAAVLQQRERQHERQAVADCEVGKGEVERFDPLRPPLPESQQEAEPHRHQPQFQIVITGRQLPRESHQIEEREGNDADHADPLQERPVHVVMRAISGIQTCHKRRH